VNEAVTNEVSQIAREIKDPRLAGLMITITGSDVSPDLKFSKIFYSVIGEHDPKETAKALKSAAPFVRSQLARRLNMRNTPEITFVFDESVERGAHLNELFRSIEKDAAASGKGENDEL
jgi:ribosome-binding factor A